MDVKVLLVKLIKTQTFLGGYIYYEKTIIASSLAVGLGVVWQRWTRRCERSSSK